MSSRAGAPAAGFQFTSSVFANAGMTLEQVRARVASLGGVKFFLSLAGF